MGNKNKKETCEWLKNFTILPHRKLGAWRAVYSRQDHVNVKFLAFRQAAKSEQQTSLKLSCILSTTPEGCHITNYVQDNEDKTQRATGEATR